MITTLNSSIKKYTHIIHVADIHIKLNKNHPEFRAVFSNLYEEIKNTPDTSCVVIAGDIFHSKIDLQPECIQVAYELFTNISNIRPLILIAGNHDLLVNNKSRLDSLTPIVDALNNPNIFYLKNTGLYGFGDILFNNMSVFDSPDKYILGKDIPPIYKNKYNHMIALFHGAIDGSTMDNGFKISNPSIPISLFDNHHIALCGDIHLMQDVQSYDYQTNKPCVRFVGSLINQNHGESPYGHGYSLWDLSNYSYKHHEIKNDFGYFTIDIKDGKLMTDLTNIPKKSRLRIKCNESIASEVKSILSKIKELTDVVEIAYVRLDKELEKKTAVIPLCKDIILTDLTNVNYQNKLISEFLQKKFKISDLNKIEEVLDINKKTNLLITLDKFSRNLKWNPIKFEFDNMFTYGEGNVIDFTKMSGVYGIFGNNTIGKSSILSAIIFCLFDKFDRGYRGSHVLNVQKTLFKCKLEFEISGVHYFIQRSGSINRTGSVKVDVKFWKIVNGVEEELHGTERRDTNDIIREYVGTYEDFILTTASFQNAKNNNSFIDMGNSERKDLMVQFIGLNIFDKLYDVAHDRNKELETILKLHKDRNYSQELQSNGDDLIKTTDTFDIKQEEINKLRIKISDINEKIVLETSNLIKLDNNVPINLLNLENKKSSIELDIKNRIKTLDECKTSIENKENLINEVDEKIKKIEESNFVENHKNYKIIWNKIEDINKKIEVKKTEIKGKLKKVDLLSKHEYDPNCKFCINNDFVRDANKAKNELLNDKVESDNMMTTLNGYKDEILKLQWVEEVYQTYTKYLSAKCNIKGEYDVIKHKSSVNTTQLDKENISLQEVINQIQLYHHNEVSVKANEDIRKKISGYRINLTELDVEFQQKNRVLMDLSGKIELYKNNINYLTKTMEEVIVLEREFESYHYYMEALGRDGISYQVICNAVPQIEQEINSILNQVVDFTIQLETDGKNIIPYVVYEHGRWPIEMTSGYERFVSSVAIRVALTNISNLPKTFFLALDEGFSTLDPEHLASMSSLFLTLKNYYEFIIVISHNDTIKDFTDKNIEISRVGSFSKVIF